MKRLIKNVIILIIIFNVNCDKSDSSIDIPDCIWEIVEKISGEPVRNPPAIVYEWTSVTGQRFYYIPPYCCDAYSDLYDSECNFICHPDGGWSGGGDGKCPEWIGHIVARKIIWKDNRIK